MRIFKVALLLLVVLITLLVLPIVALGTYYVFTPAALSSEAASLDARAKLLPKITENGYRLYGILAPADIAPEQYGKCRFNAYEQQRTENNSAIKTIPPKTDEAAYKTYLDQYNKRSALLMASCLRGGIAITLPKTEAQARIRVGTTPQQWALLAAATPDEVLIKRAETIWADGPRRLGAAADSPTAELLPLIQMERWRIAQARQKWQMGARADALKDWDRSVADWMKSADYTLVDAMVSAALFTQIQLAMQDSFARTNRVDDALAQTAIAALARVDALPVAIGESLLSEWQLGAGLARSMTTELMQPWKSNVKLPAPFAKVVEYWTRYTYDLNDTLNHMARHFAADKASTEAAARGERLADPLPPTACQSKGEWALACIVVSRNIGGRMFVAMGSPTYSHYGVRIADVRNLAAATRLTVEARRRALVGNALAQFVASAPDGMRDVFTHKAFAYDASKRQLRIELRGKNTVLGEPGPYFLTL